MANLVVSSICNMQCTYCFAQETLQAAPAAGDGRFVTLETFESWLDFLDRSGINEIRLIGGEPSLHPRFPELIERSRLRGKHILVFTHGLLAEKNLRCLEALSLEQCTVLVNMNATRARGNDSRADDDRRQEVVRCLGPRALLGANIFNTNFQLDNLLTLILQAGCRKAIRLGLAQPVLSGRNVYLHPKQYPIVGGKLAQFAQKAAEHGVRLEFDCGFVRCMFSDAALKTLQQAGADIGYRCNPILDIDLSGQALHCFPLASRFQAPLRLDSLAVDLRASLAEQAQTYRVAGVYKECSNCWHKNNGECSGGCLAATMRRFRDAKFHLAVPAAVMKGNI